MSRSKLLAAAAFALPLMVASAGGAQANVVALVIDGSGSISASDFANQKTGYINALTALLNTDGSNSIGLWEFSTGVTSVPVLAQTIITIDSVAKKNALLTAIAGITKSGGSTAIGDAVTAAKLAINAFTGTTCKVGAYAGKCVIDVSTDGDSNTGSDATAASNAAWTTNGIKVNCLGVGVAHCTFNDAAGVGTDFFASSAADFETVLRAKLSVELTKTPEPITITLFGAGLAGAAAMRRRKNKAA